MNNFLNYKRLSYYCNATEEQLLGKDNRYKFIDNGGNILGVAHVDHVGLYINPTLLKLRKHTLFYSENLDDRLGVYLLMDVLNKLTKVKYDILLTTDEEIGRSTMFEWMVDNKKIKDYRWVFELDRRGTDAVTYGLESKEWLNALKKTFTVGLGSFSDICTIEEFDQPQCGVNFGIGYYKEHTETCHMIEEDTLKQVYKIVNFIEKYHRQKFRREEKSYKISRYYSQSWDNYNGRFLGDVDNKACIYCGVKEPKMKYDTALHGYLCSWCSHGTSDDPFECDWCGKSMEESTLASHTVGGQFFYLCEDCEELYLNGTLVDDD